MKPVSDGSGSAALVAIAFQSYAEDLILKVEVYTNEDDVSLLTDEFEVYIGTVFMNGMELEASQFSSGKLISDDSVVEYLIVEIPFTPGEPQPDEPVRPESKPDPKLPVLIPVPQNPAVPGDSRSEKDPVLNIPGRSTAPAAEIPAEDPVTCEQAVLMLQRYARSLGYDADAENEAAVDGVSEWAAGAVAWSVENGVYAKADGLPSDPACRGWMAQTICGFVGFLIR